MDWYLLVKFLHLTGVLGFFIAHGASVSMLFRLRRERDPQRIRALLDLSTDSLSLLYGALLLLLVAGIVGGFMGNWWGRGWIWAGIITLVVLAALMSYWGSFFYAKVRKAVGMPYLENYKPMPAVPPASANELDVLLNSSQPLWVAGIGIAGLLLLLWLMVFKPF